MRGLRLLLLCLVLCAAASEVRGEAAPGVRLYAVGDLIFGRYLPGPGGHGKVYAPVTRAAEPLALVAPLLREADVVFGNLETPVMDEPARFSINRRFTFRADPARLSSLSRAGFQVLSLANNHMANLGAAGAPITRRHVSAAGLVPVGAGLDAQEALRPQIVERQGIKLAILAFTLWNNAGPVRPRRGPAQGAVAYVHHRDFHRVLVPRVRAARRTTGADVVVVSLHWGIEYEPHPTDDQRAKAHALIEAGADVVLGHHPHVLQDFERYRGGVIAYSLGNFLFDNPGISRRRTVILRLLLQRTDASGLPGERGRIAISPSLVPVLAGAHDALPRPAQGRDYQGLARVLRGLAPQIPLTPDPGGSAMAVR